LERRRAKARNYALAGNTFPRIADEYCSKRRRDGDRAWAPSTAARCEYLLSLLQRRRQTMRLGLAADSLGHRNRNHNATISTRAAGREERGSIVGTCHGTGRIDATKPDEAPDIVLLLACLSAPPRPDRRLDVARPARGMSR